MLSSTETLTFLFTDIEGSTELLQALGQCPPLRARTYVLKVPALYV